MLLTAFMDTIPEDNFVTAPCHLQSRASDRLVRRGFAQHEILRSKSQGKSVKLGNFIGSVEPGRRKKLLQGYFITIFSTVGNRGLMKNVQII